MKYIPYAVWIWCPLFLQAQVVLNEVMFNPAGSESSDEFVEIVNLSSDPVDLQDWDIGDGTDTDGLSSTGEGLLLASGQYGLILDPDYFHGSTSYDDLIADGCLILTLDGSTFGSGGFSNSQPETVSLFNDRGVLVDQHVYSLETEAGYSEERVEDESATEYNQWKTSQSRNGTPGRLNSVSVVPAEFEIRSLIINEIMFDPLSGDPEWFELYNRTSESMDLSGWMFSDSDTTDKILFCIENRPIDPEMYVVISEDSTIRHEMHDETALCVSSRWAALNNDGDEIQLYDPSGKSIDQVAYKDSWRSIPNTSLERVSPEGASGDSANWYSCTAPSGMTPGERNSVYASTVPAESEILVHPNPFSPDGDGFEEVTVISYQIPAETASVRLQIFDINGRLVRTLLGGSQSGSQSQVVWDGRDEGNNKASIGVYIVYLSCLNGQKTIRSEARTTVVLAGQL